MLRVDYKKYGMKFPGLIKGLFTGHSFYAVMLYRQASFLCKKRVKLLPEMLTYIARRNFSCEIAPNAKIGGGFVMHHTLGIVIGWDVRIGNDCEVFQNVTIGSSRKESNGRIMPTIGNNVKIYAGAVVTGPITIGNNVIIGANSVVTRDIPDNCFVAGAPARIIKHVGENAL